VREAPIPMLALVATAVSFSFFHSICIVLMCRILNQLYAAIQEWQTGKHAAKEFSANMYLDVYKGHVNTLEHIRENREDAYHVMMCDIYSQAT
jgi:hypothetical protein